MRLSGSSTSRVSYEHTWWQDATGPMSLNGTFRKCRSRCVMSAYRGRPEVIGAGSKRRDLPNADFKSFVLSVMKRTSDRAVMAVTCAHYKSVNNVRASRRSLVSKPSLNQPRSGTTSMSSAPGATRSPSSRQQLVEQKKPGSRPGFSFIGACPDRGLRHRPVRRHRAVRR